MITPINRAAPVEQQVRQAAQQLVSSTFLKPLLEQMRKDPLGSDLFHGGAGEDLFRSQLDTILADRITSRSELPMVEALYERLMRAIQGKEPNVGQSVDRHG